MLHAVGQLEFGDHRELRIWDDRGWAPVGEHRPETQDCRRLAAWLDEHGDDHPEELTARFRHRSCYEMIDDRADSFEVIAIATGDTGRVDDTDALTPALHRQLVAFDRYVPTNDWVLRTGVTDHEHGPSLADRILDRLVKPPVPNVVVVFENTGMNWVRTSVTSVAQLLPPSIGVLQLKSEWAGPPTVSSIPRVDAAPLTPDELTALASAASELGLGRAAAALSE